MSSHKAGILQSIRLVLSRSRLGEILVMKGLISPDDLRAILKLQKQTSEPLGKILVRLKILSPVQLYGFLGRQAALRFAAAFIFFAASFADSGSRRAKADVGAQAPAGLSQPVSLNSARYPDIASYPGLFGSQEKRSANIKPFSKWTDVLRRHERDLADPNKNRQIQKWQSSFGHLEGLPLKQMADHVNKQVNESRYILDKNNWGKSDYWATPVEFLQRGGDCEDFAIMKYTALRSLGVPESRLRIAVVHDNQKNIPHAVLVVYTEQGSFILDNQNDYLVDAERGSRYRPIYSINRTAWWLHTAPGATVVASR